MNDFGQGLYPTIDIEISEEMKIVITYDVNTSTRTCIFGGVCMHFNRRVGSIARAFVYHAGNQCTTPCRDRH